MQVTNLTESAVFMDAMGDGLLHRTAWAGAGNGVLFYGPNNTGLITEKSQYVFTEWDPTATKCIGLWELGKSDGTYYQVQHN